MSLIFFFTVLIWISTLRSASTDLPKSHMTITTILSGSITMLLFITIWDKLSISNMLLSKALETFSEGKKHNYPTGTSTLKCATFTNCEVTGTSSVSWGNDQLCWLQSYTGIHNKHFPFLLTFWTIFFPPVSSVTVHFNGICIILH